MVGRGPAAAQTHHHTFPVDSLHYPRTAPAAKPYCYPTATLILPQNTPPGLWPGLGVLGAVHTGACVRVRVGSAGARRGAHTCMHALARAWTVCACVCARMTVWGLQACFCGSPPCHSACLNSWCQLCCDTPLTLYCACSGYWPIGAPPDNPH